MSLPALARRLDLALERKGTGAPLDEWRQPTDAFVTVATWRGDIQPIRAREVPVAGEAAPMIVDTLVLADPGLVVYAGDRVRRDPADGIHYHVHGIRRVGEGLALDHLEIDATAVRRPVPV
jgi:hypothetical protein